MGADAARQRGHHVAAFEHGDDALVAHFGGQLLEVIGTPGVVFFDQLEAAHVVFVMAIEAGGDEDHLRLEFLEARRPYLEDGIAELLAAAAGGQRHVAHVGSRLVGTAIRVERVLEDAAHQDPIVTGEAILGAVAVVHVEIDDGHALQAVRLDGVHGGDTDVVEEAETHRVGLLAMVAGRAHGAEGIFDFLVHDQVDRQATGTGRAQRSLPGVRIHRGIGIEVHHAQFRRGTLDALEVGGRMHTQQLFERSQRRIVIHEVGVDTLGDQVIVDSGETLRAFRVMRTHVMQLAVAMGDKGSGRHLFSLCEPALQAAHVE